jgi:hypothetical protein
MQHPCCLRCAHGSFKLPACREDTEEGECPTAWLSVVCRKDLFDLRTMCALSMGHSTRDSGRALDRYIEVCFSTPHALCGRNHECGYTPPPVLSDDA